MGQPVEPRAASLSWVRHEGAEQCPGPAVIARGVESRIGRHVLATSAASELAVEASIGPAQPTGFRVAIRMSDAEGRTIGKRDLSSAELDCAVAAASAELVIALMIDPDAKLVAPPDIALPAPVAEAPVAFTPQPAPIAPAPPPPTVITVPVPVPARDAGPQRVADVSPWAAAVDASAALVWGVLPGAAPAVRVTGRLPALDGRFAVGIGGSYYPEKAQTVTVDEPGDVTNRISAAGVDVLGCFLPDGGQNRVGATFCLGAEIGSMRVKTTGADQSTGGTGWMVDVEGRARLDLRLSPLVLFAGAAVRLAANRDHFEVRNAAGRREDVYFRPLVGGGPEVGAGYEF
jgi:hypothetical protein